MRGINVDERLVRFGAVAGNERVGRTDTWVQTGGQVEKLVILVFKGLSLELRFFLSLEIFHLERSGEHHKHTP